MPLLKLPNAHAIIIKFCPLFFVMSFAKMFSPNACIPSLRYYVDTSSRHFFNIFHSLIFFLCLTACCSSLFSHDMHVVYVPTFSYFTDFLSSRADLTIKSRLFLFGVKIFAWYLFTKVFLVVFIDCHVSRRAHCVG